MPQPMIAIALWREMFIGRIFCDGAKRPTEESRMPQHRRPELVFYFLEFGEKKFTTVDFSTIVKT